jgi:hypothetical protein
MADGPNRGGSDGGGSFAERHLGKIVAGALVLCLLLLVGRALTGF